MDFVCHGANGIYVIVDMFVTGTPIRLLHFYQGLFYTYMYWGVFNPVYCLSGGTNARNQPYIYTTIDWRGDMVGAALRSALVVIVEVLMWSLLFILYTARRAIARRCGGILVHTVPPGVHSDLERAPLLAKNEQTQL